MENNNVSSAMLEEKKQQIIEIIRNSNSQSAYVKNKNIYADRFSLIIPICEKLGEENIARITEIGIKSFNNDTASAKEKIYKQISEIIDKMIKDQSNKQIIKYCLDCINTYNSVVNPPKSSDYLEANIKRIIDKYCDKIHGGRPDDIEYPPIPKFEWLISSTQKAEQYLSDQIDKIGKHIKSYEFLNQKSKENIFNLCKNPFLLMTIIAQITKEPEIENKIEKVITNNIKYLELKDVENQTFDELNSYNDDDLIKTYLDINSEIKDAKYNDANNQTIIKVFLDSIAIAFIKSNSYKIKEPSNSDQITSILSSLYDNLEDRISKINDEFKAVEELLKEDELKKTKKGPNQTAWKNNKENKDNLPEEKEIYNPNHNNQTLAETTRDASSLFDKSEEKKESDVKKELIEKGPKNQKEVNFLPYAHKIKSKKDNNKKEIKEIVNSASAKQEQGISKFTLDSLNIGKERSDSKDTMITTITNTNFNPGIKGGVEKVFDERIRRAKEAGNNNLKYGFKVPVFEPKKEINVDTDVKFNNPYTNYLLGKIPSNIIKNPNIKKLFINKEMGDKNK